MFNREQIVAAGLSWEPFAIPYQGTYMEIGGPGAVTTGGGFFGGGFGVQGALQGMLVASVLNTLSTKTRFETVIAITHADCQLICLWKHGSTQVVQTDLAPIFGRLRLLQQDDGLAAQASKPADDAVSKLARLAGLHASGALSDDQFEAAKQRVIDGM